MSAIGSTTDSVCGGYRGLRLTADEYFQIPDDGANYELVDGVVMVSPSPTPEHQYMSGEIFQQLNTFVHKNHLGLVLYETDVQLGKGAHGGDEVFRPAIVFVRAERMKQVRNRIVGAPDLVVEVVSPDSRLMDSRTKYDDYERAGVGEYWLIDPARNEMHFYRLDAGRLIEAAAAGDSYTSLVVPGFTLDLKHVRETFQGW